MTIRQTIVFPTRVGMDRGSLYGELLTEVFSPHAWGWTASVVYPVLPIPVFPHAWGWTGWRRQQPTEKQFSHTVGMDRRTASGRRLPTGFPTAGDGPDAIESLFDSDRFSPTRVGMDRRGF